MMGPNCVNYYTNDVSSNGCFLQFLHLSSAMCCSINVSLKERNWPKLLISLLQIVPKENRRLRAIELSVPSVVATFQVKHRNSDGIVTDAKVYNIDLNAGLIAIINVA